MLFLNCGVRNFRIFQNLLDEKFWEKIFRIFLNISEKCSNSYKNYKKNFHQRRPAVRLKFIFMLSNVGLFSVVELVYTFRRSVYLYFQFTNRPINVLVAEKNIIRFLILFCWKTSIYIFIFLCGHWIVTNNFLFKKFKLRIKISRIKNFISLIEK